MIVCMGKIALAFVSIVVLAGKTLIGSPTTVISSFAQRENATTIEEGDAGFIVNVDSANLYSIGLPADWKVMYEESNSDNLSGIVATNSDETAILYITADVNKTTTTPQNCAETGVIEAENQLIDYCLYIINDYTSEMLAHTIHNNTLYEFVMQYNSQNYPQGKELSKYSLSSFKIIK